jgi:hypothetical protein
VLPALKSDQATIYGFHLLLQVVNPLALIIAPLEYLAVCTNVVFLIQAVRMLGGKQANMTVLYLCTALDLVAVAHLMQRGGLNLGPDIFLQPAAWVWMFAVLLLLSAAGRG